MSAAIGTLPLAIRVHRAPPLDPPFDDELAPDVYRPPRPSLESTPHPADEPPSPGCQSAATRFLKVCLELFNGYRPVKQMRQLLHVEHALDLVDTLVKTKAQLDQMRLRHGGGQRLRCTGMRVCEPRRGVAEAAAVLTDGLRTWAMCYRLESDGTTWRCTYLRAALPSTRTLIATARMAAQAKSTNRSPARQPAQPHQPALTHRTTSAPPARTAPATPTRSPAPTAGATTATTRQPAAPTRSPARAATYTPVARGATASPHTAIAPLHPPAPTRAAAPPPTPARQPKPKRATSPVPTADEPDPPTTPKPRTAGRKAQSAKPAVAHTTSGRKKRGSKSQSDTATSNADDVEGATKGRRRTQSDA